MFLQQIRLPCSDPHSSFTREECSSLFGKLVEKGTKESSKLMYLMGLLWNIEICSCKNEQR
jgi:hypothetical protein